MHLGQARVIGHNRTEIRIATSPEAGRIDPEYLSSSFLADKFEGAVRLNGFSGNHTIAREHLIQKLSARALILMEGAI